MKETKIDDGKVLFEAIILFNAVTNSTRTVKKVCAFQKHVLDKDVNMNILSSPNIDLYTVMRLVPGLHFKKRIISPWFYI